MDWLALHLLPPDKPVTRRRLCGHRVTQLDLVLIGYAAGFATALYLYDGNWIWFPATAGALAVTALAFGWK